MRLKLCKGGEPIIASYHLSMKVGNCGMGFSHASYIFREGRYSANELKEQLEYKASGNLPEWAKDGKDFWKEGDLREQIGGRVYREIVVALPNELTKEQRIELTNDFIKEHLGEQYAYSVAIHSKEATLKEGVKQPHAHIMFSERKLDGIKRDKNLYFKKANTKQPERGGNKKERSWITKEKLNHLRESWAMIQNQTLEKYGHEARVDHRSFKVRRQEALENNDIVKAELLARNPEEHLGPKVAGKLAKQLKGHTKNVNNSEEKTQIREQFFNNHPNQRVRDNQNKRQHTHLTIEINKELEKEHRYTKDRINEIKKDVTLLSGKQLYESLGKHIVNVEKQIASLSSAKELLQKELISEKRAYLMAVSKITKGETKNIDQESREIKKNREKYAAYKDECTRMKKPGVFELAYKNEYEEKLTKLAKWQKDISEREEKNRVDISRIKEYLSQPEVKAKVENIQYQILENNQQINSKIEDLDDNLKELYTIRKDLKSIQLDSSRIQNKTIEIKGELSPKNISKQLPQIANQLKRAASELSREQSGPRGGINVQIHDEEEQKLDSEIKR
jgi:hypothetical protein